MPVPGSDWGTVKSGEGDQLLVMTSRDQLPVRVLAFENLDYSLPDYAGAWEKVHGAKGNLRKLRDVEVAKKGDWLRRENDGRSGDSDLRFVLVLHKREKRVYRLVESGATSAWERHGGRVDKTLAGLAIGAAERAVRWYSPDEYEKVPKANPLWAREAQPSSCLGQTGDARFATGPNDLFPRHQGTRNVWIAKSSSGEPEWLRLRFAPTRAREVRAFAVYKHLGISRVTARTSAGEEIVLLERCVSKDEVAKAGDPKVLSIELDGSAELTEITVFIRPKDAGFCPTYIDAAGLLP